MTTQLATIKELAESLIAPREIAMIIEMDWAKFRKQIINEESEISKAFYSGALQTELAINKISLSNEAKDTDDLAIRIRLLAKFKALTKIQCQS